MVSTTMSSRDTHVLISASSARVTPLTATVMSHNRYGNGKDPREEPGALKPHRERMKVRDPLWLDAEDGSRTPEQPTCLAMRGNATCSVTATSDKRTLALPRRCRVSWDTHARNNPMSTKHPTGLRKRTNPDPDAVYVPRRRRTTSEISEQIRANRRPGPAFAVVYYVRRLDGAVKIGTSSGLSSRLRHLRSTHGPLELLATELGSYWQEDRRHRQFAADALGGEWFVASDALVAHIAGLTAGSAR